MKINFELDENKKGAFFLEQEGKRIAEMKISITGDKLIVDHTEVVPEMEGKGLARKLLESMVEYAREHHLKVIPICPYTLTVFKKDPKQFEDVWYKKK